MGEKMTARIVGRFMLGDPAYVHKEVLEYGEQYLLRRFPLLQLEGVEDVRNAVSDLMFMGKYMEPIKAQDGQAQEES